MMDVTPASFRDAVTRVGADAVITMDGDLQNPPEEIPRVVLALDEGHDVVGTVRVDRQDTLLRRIPSTVTNFIVRRTTGVRMSDYGCMLRGYRRPVVEAMLGCAGKGTFIPVLANRSDMKVLGKTFWNNLRELDPDVVRKQLDPYLDGRQIEALLARQKKIVKAFKRLISQHGEQAILFEFVAAPAT